MPKFNAAEVGAQARELHFKLGVQTWPIEELSEHYARALAAVAALAGPVEDVSHAGIDIVLPESNRDGWFAIFTLHDDYLVFAEGAAATLLPWRQLERVGAVVTEAKWDQPRPSSVVLYFRGLAEPVRLTERVFKSHEILWALHRARRALAEGR